MKKILFVTDAKATFESVRLLQDLIHNALLGNCHLTIKNAGTTSVETYQDLLQSHDAIVGNDANLFQARREANCSVPMLMPSYGLGTRGLLQIWEWREGLQQGDAFICPSTADLAAASVHLKNDQIRLIHIPYPIPDVYFEEKYDQMSKSSTLSRLGIDADSQSAWLLYSGRLNQQKNVHLVLRIVHSLRKMGFSVGLVIVGNEDTSGFPELGWENTGYANDLLRLAEELQIQNCVHFLGTVDRQTMYDLYHCVDLHLTCSTFRTEDFGFVPVEAMACGVPTVSTGWGGFWDTVQHGLTGYRVPVHLTPMGFRVDWHAAALRIARILSDKSLRTHLKKCCRILAQSQFTPKLFKQRILEAIELITREPRRQFRPLDLTTLVDEQTQQFFKDLSDRTEKYGSILAARKGLFIREYRGRVKEYFSEYSRSEPVKWSLETVLYTPLPHKLKSNEVTTLDRNWSATVTLSEAELRMLSQLDETGTRLSKLAASMGMDISEIARICEEMFMKGIIIPLDSETASLSDL